MCNFKKILVGDDDEDSWEKPRDLDSAGVIPTVEVCPGRKFEICILSICIGICLTL